MKNQNKGHADNATLKGVMELEPKKNSDSMTTVGSNKKKDFKIVQTDKQFNLYEIRYKGGGEMPAALKSGGAGSVFL